MKKKKIFVLISIKCQLISMKMRLDEYSRLQDKEPDVSFLKLDIL